MTSVLTCGGYLDMSQKMTVAKAMKMVSTPNGENVITQGDDGDYFYMIDSGTAEVLVKKGDADPIVVTRYGPGDTFGELALLHGDKRSATVRVLAFVDVANFRLRATASPGRWIATRSDGS
jgi:CRP-like cAMP-binding protein